jgi:hypothetical protein
MAQMACIKSYTSHIDVMNALDCQRVPNYYKFSVEDNETTMEHFNFYLAQLGEATAFDDMHYSQFSFISCPYIFFVFFFIPTSSIGSL